ncbi:V-type proton ATPase proteolipid subunit 2 [Pseudogymnoascus sp. 24MN13]|uniref:V-type proton ATPase proteolipid subunit n=1 Tax=Pseudogymnoascus verrucosus TaxID=342668 RepID=A0A1B8GIG3_9PEZI|nr:v-type proton ATPase 16 kDa proteolipid subunit 2 [Pseudogymnoascus verrucosus]OBT58251.1 V-type proton ATPase proteolipid subunit 2 [Pseudogymnoascus sp. 24MN13]OBT95609.1 v-type proton ATPase 16 kDa proteolipid subunit 2 [Pseudogymnoascus verrucosus]
MAESERAPKFAPFLGMAGAAFAMIFGCMGAAYGTFRSGAAVAAVGVERPDLVMKSLLPTVMAGIISVYALVVSLLIVGDMSPPPKQNYSLYSGNMHLAAGISVGMTGLAAGYGIGVIGEHGIRAYIKQSRIFVPLVLLLIFAEVLGLYGLIVALILNTRTKG